MMVCQYWKMSSMALACFCWLLALAFGSVFSGSDSPDKITSPACSSSSGRVSTRQESFKTCSFPCSFPFPSFPFPMERVTVAWSTCDRHVRGSIIAESGASGAGRKLSFSLLLICWCFFKLGMYPKNSVLPSFWWLYFLMNPRVFNV